MKQVLLAVAGIIPADLAQQISAGRRPRAGYLELARSCEADLIDYRIARADNSIVGRLCARLGRPHLMLAWACFMRRHQYQAIVTSNEQVGLALATLLKLFSPNRRPRHLMLAHQLSHPKQQALFDRFGVQSHIDRFIVDSPWQQRFISERWYIPPQRAPYLPVTVDEQFFHPRHAPPRPTVRLQIVVVGFKQTDYQTLLQAVAGLHIDVVVAAAGLWITHGNSNGAHPFPPNVRIQAFTPLELRQLYSDSRFVVMLLEPVDAQVGSCAILEAMAMERAVICTRIPGQSDLVVDGVSGISVPPRDPAALRAAIEQLLAEPGTAAQMGRMGRQLVEQRLSLDHYTTRMTDILYEALAEASVEPAPVKQKEQS
ncbi:glycosyltransferase family 4 protein [Chloroflexus sp.]|uniref:glycosyltransferase family 4 protein n=1 Tax=Chloroflexus sp. TaxID=1904827 RepID=UPI002ACD81AD|nr:glycosyltransferase family 4 protein [Chloroflexus sp.]